MKYIAKTDVGNFREINEDSYLVKNNKLGQTLYVIADGMGGHNAGEIASYITTEILEKEFEKAEYSSIQDFLKESILKSNTVIYTNSLINKEYNKMGTTLSAIVVDDTSNKVYIGHIGDSRIYYFNKELNKKYQLTTDHTIIQILYEQGYLKKEELSTHPRRNILSRSLGTTKKISIDILELKLPPSGYLLLCSDGLSDEVDEDKMYKIITKDDELENKAQQLMLSALNNQGKDNITFILIER